MNAVFEVVTGQVLLSQRERFFELHANVLLPIMRDIGITPKLLLITEIGRYGRFLDVYRYENLSEYQRLTDQLLSDPRITPYYEKVGKCVHGSITVEIMRSLPYAAHWVSEVRT